MALIKCPECGREISDKAESCPNCGLPMWKTEEKQENLQKVSREFEINGVRIDIEEMKNKLFIQTVANTAKKVRKLCKCSQDEAELAVYGYFFSTHGEYSGNETELRDKIKHAKSFSGKNLYCPYCLGRNIDIQQNVTESVSKGKAEARKKSAATRAGNKAGRAGMIMMTGGLWALTPKKSDYNEVSKGKTEYHTTTTKTCMDCGRQIF